MFTINWANGDSKISCDIQMENWKMLPHKCLLKKKQNDEKDIYRVSHNPCPISCYNLNALIGQEYGAPSIPIFSTNKLGSERRLPWRVAA